jgi:hypothetical protein
MKMVPFVMNAERNALLVIILKTVLLVLETELNLKMVVLAHICIMTLVKMNVHLAVMLVKNAI